MRTRVIHASVTLLHIALLTSVYLLEISTYFSYMGFSEISVLMVVLVAAPIAVALSFVLSLKIEVRNLFLVFFHYMFFVPSLIIATTESVTSQYFLVLLIAVLLIIVTAHINFHSLRIVALPSKFFFWFLLAALAMFVCLLAVFGGLRYFNLNIFSVYEFRRDAASNMPGFFSYIFSGVSKVIAPITLVLAVHLKKPIIAIFSIALVVLMFGMTHHKSVLILPVLGGVLYWLLNFRHAVILVLACFVVVVCLSLVELVYKELIDSNYAALFTSISIRRAIFVPPLLDSIYVSYFDSVQKFYWSTSRFGLGLAENPYGTTAPFLIGAEFFGREETSANTGVIGSGYANAGLVGVVIYSIFLGGVVSMLQAFGRVINHRIVFAGSFSIVMSVLNSTDPTTAILTHGLLLLFLLLITFPRWRQLTHARA